MAYLYSQKVNGKPEEGFQIHYYGLAEIESIQPTKEAAAARVNYLNGGAGLTKKETFALAIMSGYAARTLLTPEQLTEHAEKVAEKLIKTLAK